MLIAKTFGFQGLFSLIDEGLDTKSEGKIKVEASGEGLDTKSESQVKIDLSQTSLGTKSERLVSQILLLLDISHFIPPSLFL